MNKSTTIDEPYFDGPGGMLIGSTDILPTELRESSCLLQRLLRLS